MKRKLLKLYVNNFPGKTLHAIRVRKSIKRDSMFQIKRNWMFEGNRTDFVHQVSLRG
jgi:hypothetical protein